MGHDLPRAAWPRIIDAIAANARRAESDPYLEAPPPSVPGLG
jgi:hypothetical protein